MKHINFKYKYCFAVLGLIASLGYGFVPTSIAQASYRFADFEGRPPLHIFKAAQTAASGVTPAEIKKIYNLPSTGGTGTIAIIDAYDDPTIESDLAAFDKQFGLATCTTKNGCFEKHMMAASTTKDS